MTVLKTRRVSRMDNKKKTRRPMVEHTEIIDEPEAPKVEQRPKRLTSLDAFRGLTIVGMLLMNNLAVGRFAPRQLTHAPWNSGVNFADLVFPWFLFIVGVAIPFSSASSKRKGVSTCGHSCSVVRRAVILVILGCLVDSSIAHSPTLGLGILQVIGLAYLIGSVVYLLPLPARLSIAALFLAAHWWAIKYIPVPGVGTHSFAEQANLIDYLNRTYLEPLHLKGLISVIPTSALVIIGSGIGDLLHGEKRSGVRKFLWMVAAGAFLTVAGQLWSHDIPFNKPIWTASYIVYTAGLGTLALSIFYVIIDVLNVRFWAFPFVVFGMNAIVAYVAPILVKIYILQGWHMTGSDLSIKDEFLNSLVHRYGTLSGGWYYTTVYIVFWWLVLLYMHRKKLFLRV